MAKNKKIIYYLTLIPLVIILIGFGWLFSIIFEGEPPEVNLSPLPEYISHKQEFHLNLSDRKRGIKELKVSYSQGGNQVNILDMKFPFVGFLNERGVKSYQKTIDFDPAKLRLAQGRVDLDVQVWDYSRRNGGDGNRTLVSHSMIVDTIPPSIRALSRMHNVSVGGTGLVVYRTSSDTVESGVYVNDLFFQGFPADKNNKEGAYVAYFALPYNVNKDPSIYLWAKDKADNTTRSTFNYHIIRKHFNSEKFNISDNFLKRILPYFSYLNFDPKLSDIDKFIKINRDIRKKDNLFLRELLKKTSPERYWEGTWLRLKNAATMAKFADHRSYYYKGKKIDDEYHLGVDLASLANSPVQAANNGVVVFAQRNDIYGLSIVIDHGQGLASLYGHLSSINVAPGNFVKKGAIIGYTGQTGLAGGDHLHFSVLVHGVFVNPIEWWDPHWIEDNITEKLLLANKAE